MNQTAYDVLSDESTDGFIDHSKIYVLNNSHHLPADVIVDITYYAGFILVEYNNGIKTTLWRAKAGSYQAM